MSNSTYCDDHYEQPEWMRTIEDLEKQNKELKKQLSKYQKMMKDALSGFIKRNNYTKTNVLRGLDITCDAIQKFKDGDKVKLIIVKEE